MGCSASILARDAAAPHPQLLQAPAPAAPAAAAPPAQPASLPGNKEEQAAAPRAALCAVSLEFLLLFWQRVCSELGEEAQHMSSGDVIQRFVVPATRQRQGRYIDDPTLVPVHQASSSPTFFISHCWKNPFRLLIDGVRHHLHGATPSAVWLWLDAIALNQHSVGSQTEEELLGKLEGAVRSCTEGTLVIMDDEGGPCMRVWCLAEVWTTLRVSGPAALHILTPGFSAQRLSGVFQNISIKDAHATRQEDKEMILRRISRLDPEGLRGLNTQLRLVLLLQPLEFPIARERPPAQQQCHLDQSYGQWLSMPRREPPESAGSSGSGSGHDADIRRSSSHNRLLVVSGPEASCKTSWAVGLCSGGDTGPRSGGEQDGPGPRLQRPAASLFCNALDPATLDPLRLVKTLAYQLAYAPEEAVGRGLGALLRWHLSHLDVRDVQALQDADSALRLLLLQPLSQEFPPPPRLIREWEWEGSPLGSEASESDDSEGVLSAGGSVREQGVELGKGRDGEEGTWEEGEENEEDEEEGMLEEGEEDKEEEEGQEEEDNGKEDKEEHEGVWQEWEDELAGVLAGASANRQLCEQEAADARAAAGGDDEEAPAGRCQPPAYGIVLVIDGVDEAEPGPSEAGASRGALGNAVLHVITQVMYVLPDLVRLVVTTRPQPAHVGAALAVCRLGPACSVSLLPCVPPPSPDESMAGLHLGWLSLVAAAREAPPLSLLQGLGAGELAAQLVQRGGYCEAGYKLRATSRRSLEELRTLCASRWQQQQQQAGKAPAPAKGPGSSALGRAHAALGAELARDVLQPPGPVPQMYSLTHVVFHLMTAVALGEVSEPVPVRVQQLEGLEGSSLSELLLQVLLSWRGFWSNLFGSGGGAYAARSVLEDLLRLLPAVTACLAPSAAATVAEVASWMPSVAGFLERHPGAALSLAAACPAGSAVAGAARRQLAPAWRAGLAAPSGVNSFREGFPVLPLSCAADWGSGQLVLRNGRRGGDSVHVCFVHSPHSPTPLVASTGDSLFSFHPDERGVKEVWLEDSSSGTLLTKLRRHKGDISCMAASPDGSLLASGSRDLGGHAGVHLWSIALSQRVALLPLPGQPRCVDWSPCGRLLLTAVGSFCLVWRVQHDGVGGCSARVLVRLRWSGEVGAAAFVAVEPPGYAVAVCSGRRGLEVWTLPHAAAGEAKQLAPQEGGRRGQGEGAVGVKGAVEVDCRQQRDVGAAATGEEGAAWCIAAWPCRNQSDHALGRSNNDEDEQEERWLCVASVSSGVRESAAASSLCFATAVCGEREVRLFTLPNSACTAGSALDRKPSAADAGVMLTGHGSGVCSICCTGSLLASGDAAGCIRLWSLPGGEGVLVLTGHTKPVASLAFQQRREEAAAAGGGPGAAQPPLLLASGSTDRSVRIWRVQAPASSLRALSAAAQPLAGAPCSLGASPAQEDGSNPGASHLWRVEFLPMTSATELHAITTCNGCLSLCSLPATSGHAQPEALQPLHPSVGAASVAPGGGGCEAHVVAIATDGGGGGALLVWGLSKGPGNGTPDVKATQPALLQQATAASPTEGASICTCFATVPLSEDPSSCDSMPFTLVAGYADGSLVSWVHSARGWQCHGLGCKHSEKVHSIMASSDGRHLMTHSASGSRLMTLLWSASSSAASGWTKVTQLDGVGSAPCLSPAGDMVASCSDSADVALHEARRDGRVLAQLRAHRYAPKRVMFSPGGQLLVSVGGDAAVAVYHVGCRGRHARKLAVLEATAAPQFLRMPGQQRLGEHMLGVVQNGRALLLRVLDDVPQPEGAGAQDGPGEPVEASVDFVSTLASVYLPHMMSHAGCEVAWHVEREQAQHCLAAVDAMGESLPGDGVEVLSITCAVSTGEYQGRPLFFRAIAPA